MDNKIIAIMALAVAVSGCTDLIETNESPDGIEPDPGKGLEITELSVADQQLSAGKGNAGQRTEVRLVLSNHHEADIDPEIEFANTGQLQTDANNPSEAQCNAEKLDGVTAETVDQMECTRGIYAPNRETMGSFDQKTESVTVMIKYDSQIVNRKPLKFQFKDRTEITDSNPVERKFANNEVQMTVKTDNPSPMSPDYNDFEVEFSNVGSGDVISEEGEDTYDPINYQPSGIFQGCPEGGEGRIGSEFSATCSFNVDQPTQRNVFVSAEYKYQKQQTLPITIVR